jgi:hypothetical protein
MKIRNDSPFAKLTVEEQELILDLAESMKLSDLADHVETKFAVTAGVTVAALKRFLRRMRTRQSLKEAEEAEKEIKALAQRAKNSQARDAALEAARQRMCSLAADCENRGELSAMIKALSEEKAREHELMMREREVAVSEEQSKLAWRKLEVEMARAQMKLLPRALEILSDAALDDTRKVAETRRCLMTWREAGVAGRAEKVLSDKLRVANKETHERKFLTTDGTD